MKIWQRYLLGKLTLPFLVILFCFFATYVFIDLSLHGVRFFAQKGASFFDLLCYYLRSFSLHLDLFSPLAFLLASCKALFDLSSHLELVALQAGGLSKKKLLAPFFFFAACLSSFSYMSHEWVVPDATAEAERFKNKNYKPKEIHSLALQDGSQVVYQSFDQKEFYDFFWIRSPKDIWSCKTVSGQTGREVNHFVRNAEGLLVKSESFEVCELEGLHLPQEIGADEHEQRPLSALLQGAGAKTQLHRKLALPLLPLLIAFAVLPFAMTFSRSEKRALVVGASLFGFIATMALFESLTILGENQVLAPKIAMWTPIAMILGLSCRKFWKM